MLPLRSLGARHAYFSRAVFWRSPFLAQTRARSTPPQQNTASRQVSNELPQLSSRPSAQEKYAYLEAFARKYEHLRTQQEQDGTAAWETVPEPEWEAFVRAEKVKQPKYLRPAIWAVAFSVGTFSLLAFLQAREELKPKSSSQWNWPPIQPKKTTGPVEVITRAWDEFDPISKLTIGVIGVNAAVQLGNLVLPKQWSSLVHVPAYTADIGRWTKNGPSFRPVGYHTLLTSTFAHFGVVHFLVNMYACYNFLPPVGHSRLFEGSAYHTLAFFLSSGVLSGYAQHLQTFARRGAQWTRSAGASGALFAVLGAFCMQYPNAGVGIILIPYSVAASTLLPCVMMFDLYGLIRGIPKVNFGHAAHLSGALIGVAYSYYDGNKKVWRPMVDFFKRSLRN